MLWLTNDKWKPGFGKWHTLLIRHARGDRLFILEIRGTDVQRDQDITDAGEGRSHTDCFHTF